jgi:hypothetical protein
MLTSTNQSTWQLNPREHHQNCHCRKNLKSQRLRAAEMILKSMTGINRKDKTRHTEEKDRTESTAVQEILLKKKTVSYLAILSKVKSNRISVKDLHTMYVKRLCMVTTNEMTLSGEV